MRMCRGTYPHPLEDPQFATQRPRCVSPVGKVNKTLLSCLIASLIKSLACVVFSVHGGPSITKGVAHLIFRSVKRSTSFSPRLGVRVEGFLQAVVSQRCCVCCSVCCIAAPTSSLLSAPANYWSMRCVRVLMLRAVDASNFMSSIASSKPCCRHLRCNTAAKWQKRSGKRCSTSPYLRSSNLRNGTCIASHWP